MKPIGAYIHIPFCVKKCPYCDFYSLPLNKGLVDEYVSSLCKNIKDMSKIYDREIDSIYFGGGTPNLIGTDNIGRILEAVHCGFKILNPEITVEINPSAHTSIDFRKLKNTGVNRLSIGMQSINDDELFNLGRRHNSHDIKQTLYKSKNAGFYNISLDIMLALPNQKNENLINSLSFCVENNLPHVSVYLLKIEKNTDFYKIKNTLPLPDEERAADLYLLASNYLASRGYEHYEISNFCKKGMESRHNLKYWNCDEYLGFGPSAHSFMDGKRFYYQRSIKKFIENPVHIMDSSAGYAEEFCMLRLRLAQGIKSEEYKKRFGRKIPNIYYDRARKYVDLGLVSTDESGIKLTPQGFLVSNALIVNIIY